MPRKLKVVDITANAEETAVSVEPVPDAPALAPEENVVESCAEPVVAKRKAKAPKAPKQVGEETVQPPEPPATTAGASEPVVSKKRSKAKPRPVEEPVVEEHPIPEPEEQTEPVEAKNIKTVELVECPDCKKKLTQRTLRYSHQAVCPAKHPPEPKPKREKRVVVQEPMEPLVNQATAIRRLRSQRFAHLINQAF